VDRPETETIAAALAGDAAAHELLYATHAGRIKVYLLRSGFSHADAADLLQETFARAFRSLGTFDASRGSFRPWLSTIARNVARKQWARRPQPDHFDPEMAEEMLGVEDNPHASTAEREEIDSLRDCIARLPELLIRIVHLRYVEGRTTRGISAATGTPEATVRLRLGEAQAKLRECLRSKGVLE
jgi:RNA polymerase sigma-70 factor (ECF subfamily)